MAGHPVFAWFMHHVFRPAQPPALWELRRQLVGRARGVVAEVGAGDGVNLGLYDPHRTRAVLALEPDPYLRRHLEAAAAGAPVPVQVLQAEAEDLPLAAASVDSVVFSLVLCTVRDPQRALAEAHRVLRPGGRVLFLEHVASSQPGWRRLQQLMTPAWSRVAGGCHLDRETLAIVAQDGLRPAVLRRWGGRALPVILAEAVRDTKGDAKADTNGTIRPVTTHRAATHPAGRAPAARTPQTTGAPRRPT